MRRYYHAVRRPIRRPRGDDYLLLTLLSFALSVSLTRLFLELTGYPQLGSGTLHIAHMLWGGLLLFIAALLPLIFANRWVYRVEAVLAGMGVGLFIDEVGKFITQSNDYFYPPAAPIVYAFFLICVLVYLQINRPPSRHPRAELYTALEMMEEVIDHDLDAHERAELEIRLHYVVAQKDQPELARLAAELLDYVKDEQIYIVPPPPDYLKRLEAKLIALQGYYLDRARYRAVLALGLGALGLVSIVNAIRLMASNIEPGAPGFAFTFVLESVKNPSYTYVLWFFMLQVVQGLFGMLLTAGAVLLVTGRERQGIRSSYFALLVYLTMVNLLMFYYYQFSTIISAIIQFVLLLAVLYYQQRFLT
jgi:hypothetical protein